VEESLYFRNYLISNESLKIFKSNQIQSNQIKSNQITSNHIKVDSSEVKSRKRRERNGKERRGEERRGKWIIPGRKAILRIMWLRIKNADHPLNVIKKSEIHAYHIIGMWWRMDLSILRHLFERDDEIDELIKMIDV
jgi:hypothetical protein